MQTHSAEVVYNRIVETDEATREKVIQSLPLYARATVQNRIKQLLALDMIYESKGGTLWCSKVPFSLEPIQQATMEANLASMTNPNRKEAKRKIYSEASKVRSKLRSSGAANVAEQMATVANAHKPKGKYSNWADQNLTFGSNPVKVEPVKELPAHITMADTDTVTVTKEEWVKLYESAVGKKEHITMADIKADAAGAQYKGSQDKPATLHPVSHIMQQVRKLNVVEFAELQAEMKDLLRGLNA